MDDAFLLPSLLPFLLPFSLLFSLMFSSPLLFMPSVPWQSLQTSVNEAVGIVPTRSGLGN